MTKDKGDLTMMKNFKRLMKIVIITVLVITFLPLFAIIGPFIILINDKSMKI